jgi:SAM-dependent methyltransferase
MRKSDDDNVDLATSPADVDRLNSDFYGKYPYPWPPLMFEAPADPQFYARMLSQDVGWFSEPVLPKSGARIWVAGCGTNQAVITAFNFPEALVQGSDLSETSLAFAAKNAAQLGLENLKLTRESLNEAPYREEFDYVICTGVIHHNADPSIPLSRLAAALKPGGVMELMVYNRVHTIPNTVFQRAMHLLAGDGRETDFPHQLALAKKLMVEAKGKTSLMARFIQSVRTTTDSQIADYLVQPVWHSYTVESFEELCAGQGLELLCPTVNQFDAVLGRVTWNMPFADPEIARTYDAFPDTKRWQITNLLQFDESPRLWFYVQRKDSPRKRRTEHEVCEAFLRTRFRRTKTEKIVFKSNSKGDYEPAPRVPFPPAPKGPEALKILSLVDPGAPISAAFAKAGISTSFAKANRLRLELTTSTHPYLEAVTSA